LSVALDQQKSKVWAIEYVTVNVQLQKGKAGRQRSKDRSACPLPDIGVRERAHLRNISEQKAFTTGIKEEHREKLRPELFGSGLTSAS
jgi:hypothetical protein